MNKVVLIFLLFVSLSCLSNDGAYLTRGGAIYPVKETRISLESEILSFKVRDRLASVNIQFQFNNPEDIERKLLVGFQAPTAEGDISNEEANTTIIDFVVIQDAKILPYNLKVAECENCELKKPGEIYFSQFEPGVFVYLFEVTFKPGINVINHSYKFHASSNIVANQIYEYILTTGAKWAGGKIKDLTVNIDVDENQYFYANDVYGETAKWKIIGTGLVTKKNFNFYGDVSYKIIRTLSGYLQIKVNNFSPTNNIDFGIINEDSFSLFPVVYDENEQGEELSLSPIKDLKKLNSNQLKILRNSLYAKYGYIFSDKKLHNYFLQYEWYIPNPNTQLKDINLNKREQTLLEQILIEEKRRE